MVAEWIVGCSGERVPAEWDRLGGSATELQFADWQAAASGASSAIFDEDPQCNLSEWWCLDLHSGSI